MNDHEAIYADIYISFLCIYHLLFRDRADCKTFVMLRYIYLCGERNLFKESENITNSTAIYS